MIFKAGVRINGIKPEMLVAMMVVGDCMPNVRITSVTEGRHSRTSLHYVGYAIDIGVLGYTPAQVASAVLDIKESLTDEFDVLNEGNHIHIEFQPKLEI